MNPAVLSTPPLVTPRRSDFADWLSPILVKELRQGLKSRMFVVAFVVVQAVMILIVGLRLITLGPGDQRGANTIFEGFFGTIVWLALLVVMPARGLGAIGEETRAQTLDLVQLTRLSAFRIVWGKWLALVAQTCLLATAMLPYAVLRYYFGQVDVVAELMQFALLLIASMVLTASTVSVSVAPVAVRIFVLMLILPGLMIYASATYVARFMGAMGSPTIGGVSLEVFWLLPVAALYIYFFLELGASRIAPAAENHSSRKRFLALVLSAVTASVGWWCSREVFTMCALTAAPIVLFSIVEALCEVPTQVPGVYRAFAGRGIAGRLLGRALYPGWASGVVFTALALVLFWAGVLESNWRFSMADDNRKVLWQAGPMLLFAFVSPLPFMQLFPRLKIRFGFYLLLQVLGGLVYAVVAMITAFGAVHREAIYLLGPVPTAAAMSLLAYHADPELIQSVTSVAPYADAVLGIWLGILVLRQFDWTRKMERQSLGETPAAPEPFENAP